MTDEKKQETKKYEVTKKHCHDYKLGEIIELTEDKAKKLSNKIIPYVVKVAGDSDQDLLDALNRVDELEAELAELKKAAESPLTEKKAKGGK